MAPLFCSTRQHGGALLKLLGVASLLAGLALTVFVYQTRPQWFGVDLASDEAWPTPPPPPAATTAPPVTPPADSEALIDSVLASSTEIFGELMARGDMVYQPPQVIRVSGPHSSPCDPGLQIVGSHYCRANRTLYLDLQQLTALQVTGGDAAYLSQAYLITHLLGVNLGQQAGIDSRFLRAFAQAETPKAAALGTRRALLNDCLAGIWLRYAEPQLGWLKHSALSEAMVLVNSQNHQRLEQLGTGQALRVTFDHGTFSQREYALHTGYDNGSPNSCDPLLRDG